MKRLPVVAIVGRPNVGKSSLFNRLIGKRVAIVENVPGITRDRIVHEANVNGYEVLLVDTGGVDTSREALKRKVLEQANEAMREADVIVFVVDGREGINPLDEEVARILRKWKKPVIVAVNKVDEPFMEDVKYEAYRLGFDRVIGISTIHKIGIEELKEAIVESIPEELKEFSRVRAEEERESENVESAIESGGKALADIVRNLEEGKEVPVKAPVEEPVKVAIVGRPNMGKSTLFNAILGRERAIVSEIPGTTRDAIDSYVNIGGKEYVFIDTAGIRRRGKIKDIEYYSFLRSVDAIERADVVILLLDATEGITERDTKIAGLALKEFKPVILAVNKVDAVDRNQIDRLKRELEMSFDFIPYAPRVFISARTGEGIDKLLKFVDELYEQFTKRVKTGEFNRAVKEILNVHQPPVYRGKAVKIYYGTQVKVKPPTFLLFSNYPEGITKSFRKFLENRLRRRFGFSSIPIRLIFKKRG